MNEEEKKAIEKFVEKCNKFDESVEIKGVSVGEEYRILETVCKALVENCSNYVIPIQKVKDKIEEYKNMLKTCNKVKDIDRIKAINERILELEELLEWRK